MAASKPKETGASATLTCYVLSNFDHDCQRYEPGDSVDLDDKTAQQLLALGVVSRVPQIADEAPLG
jgi:hypothetical protein